MCFAVFGSKRKFTFTDVKDNFENVFNVEVEFTYSEYKSKDDMYVNISSVTVASISPTIIGNTTKSAEINYNLYGGITSDKLKTDLRGLLVLITTQNTYNVTFDKKSGTGGSDSIIATYNSAMPSAYAPVRTGYTFGGYWTGENGTGTQYYDLNMDSVADWNVAENTILYAKWTANTYTVSLDQQSGSDGTTSVTATYDSAMPTATKPTRTGYTFAGYYDATSGGTKYYNADMSSAKNWDKIANTTLYAKWTINKYTLVWNGNEGSLSGGTTAGEVDYNTSLTAPTATRNGYTFNGWNPAVPATMPASDATYTAQWTANTYTVEFNGNGSTGGSTTKISNCVYDKDVTLTANSFTKTGYTFKEWNTAANGTGTSYANSASVKNLSATNGGTVTLYVQWTANKYEIVFNGNGSTGGSTAKISNCEYDKDVTLTANGFTKTGYTFAGWATSTSGNVEYSDKKSVSNLTSAANGTFNLYAKWTANTYTVTLDRQNGSDGTTSVSATYDSAMPGATAPTRTGYTFTGYYDAKSGGTKYYDANMSSANIWDKPNAATLYAQWTENGYSVSINDNGGNGGSESVTAKYDNKVASVSIPRKTGYEFGGYWTAVTNGIKIIDETGNIIYGVEGYTDNDGKWKHTEEVTLYAHWTGIQKVEYDKEATSGVVFGLNLESLGGVVTRVDIITPSSVADASGNKVSSTNLVSYTDLDVFKNKESGLWEFEAESSPVNYDENIVANIYSSNGTLLKKVEKSPKDCALALVTDTDINVSKQAKAYLIYCEAMKNLYYTNIASSNDFYNSYSNSFETVEWDDVENAVINKDTSIINDYSGLEVKSSSDFEMNLGVSEKTSVEFLIKAKKIESGEYRRQDEYKVTVTGLGSNARLASGETLIGLSHVFEYGDVYYAIRIEDIPVEELNQKYEFEITRTSRINPSKIVERYTGSFCAMDFMKIYHSQFENAADALYLYYLYSQDPQ